jgi:hypothetical protein
MVEATKAADRTAYRKQDRIRRMFIVERFSGLPRRTAARRVLLQPK